MNKKRLLKSIIGTVAIYGVLLALLFIFRYIDDLGVYLYVHFVTLSVCSITAGLLFKGKLYATVWSAATVIFFFAICVVQSGWDFESFMGAVILFLIPLLIPFLFARFCITVRSWEKERASEGGTIEKETQIEYKE